MDNPDKSLLLARYLVEESDDGMILYNENNKATNE